VSVTIKTNYHRREVLDSFQLTAEEAKEFDYLDWSKLERGEDSASFVRYRGWVYDLNDTEGTFPEDRRWFYRSDSFFSGVVFMYPASEWNDQEIDPDYIICGTYYAS